MLQMRLSEVFLSSLHMGFRYKTPKTNKFIPMNEILDNQVQETKNRYGEKYETVCSRTPCLSAVSLLERFLVLHKECLNIKEH